MQTAAFIDDRLSLADCQRLCYGHPTCPSFLYCDEPLPTLPPPLTVVLPPLCERHMAARDRFLQRLEAAWPNAALEISAGDLGTLCFLNRYRRVNGIRWSLAAGPFMGHQDTDPLLFDYLAPSDVRIPAWDGGERAELISKTPSPQMIDHWATPQAFSMGELLKRYGADRMELCAQPIPWRLCDAPLPVTAYGAAFLSMSPCTGRCPCHGNSLAGMRGGKTLRWWRNLLWYHDERPMPADRIVFMRAMDSAQNTHS